MEETNDLTIKRVAQELDISYTTVLNMVYRDQLKAVRRGGRWFISEEEFNRFQKEGNHPDSKEGEEDQDE